jgi:hypothetical protein
MGINTYADLEEKGKRMMNEKTIRKICLALNMQKSFLPLTTKSVTMLE